MKKKCVFLCFFKLFLPSLSFSEELKWSGHLQLDQSFFKEKNIEKVSRNERFYDGSSLRKAQLSFSKKIFDNTTIFMMLDFSRSDPLGILFVNFNFINHFFDYI